MKISEFVSSSDRLSVTTKPEFDALRDEGALEDAALIGLKLDLVRSNAYLLFDCRVALNIREGDTAVLVLRSLRNLAWSGPSAEDRVWRAVDMWRITKISGAAFALESWLTFDEPFSAQFGAGEFYIGSVPGIYPAPPSFLHASERSMVESLQGWDSEFHVVSASFLGN